MDIVIMTFSLVVLLFSVIIHELAHGYMANSLGDPTAKYEGRLTLNPLKHLDPFGSIILPLLLFISQSPILIGWAKPVPINPHNFKDKKWGTLKVSLAGPATNLFMAVFFGLLIRFIPEAFFNIFPGMLIILSFIVQINLIVAIFNLVPIPPLDGSWILFKFIPPRFENIKRFLTKYGFLILIFLLLFNWLEWLGVVTMLLYRVIIGS